MVPKLVVRLTILAVMILAYARGQQLKTMAVLDFEAFGISQVESAVLTNRMRSGLVMTGKVIVVERGMMQQVIAEQDFSLAGCVSDECAVEVGRLLGVSHMVAGSIGKIGTTFAMDIRIIDVESGVIAKTVTGDFQGTIDGLLKEIERLAQTLVVGEEPAPASREEVVSSRDVTPTETGAETAEADVTPTVTLPTQPGEGPMRADESLEILLKDIPEGEPLVRPAGYIPHDEPPEPIGGYDAILQNTEYPELARAEGIEGMVRIQAFVDKTGKVTETRILKGFPGSGLNEAAVAAVRGTRFRPAEYRGQPVGVWVAVPVPFKLEGEAW